MKKRFILYVVLCAFILEAAGCGGSGTNTGNVGTNTTTISGKIMIMSDASPSTSASQVLTAATVELYDADRLEWLYPVSVTQSDSDGNYTFRKLANAAENGDAYRDNNPIPAGRYTIIAYKYDANTGTLYVAVQTVVKTYRGNVTGNDLVALDSGITPAVLSIGGMSPNPDGTFGGPTAVVPSSAAIQITFNTEMARISTVNAISIRDSNDSNVPGVWKVSPDLLSATFSPASGCLSAGALYTITILGGTDPGAARNLYGNPIPATVAGSFVAADSDDETAPSVVLFDPQLLTNVSVTTQIQIASDEPLDIDTLLVSAEPTIGETLLVQYAGTIGTAARPYVYTIVPTAPLQPGTMYQFTINGIKDTAGNVSAPLLFSFSTAAVPPPPAANLMGGAIQNGSLNLTAGSSVSVLAGGWMLGSADGTGTSAFFNNPRGMATDGTNLYVVDMSNHTIRRIVIATREVTTLAGLAGVSGSADGTGSAARFNYPTDITMDGSSLYVADQGNATIRKIVIATGEVTTLAGKAGVIDNVDGPGSVARFGSPNGITTDGINLYVTDSASDSIRQIVIASGYVTTLAGSSRSSGSSDGIGSAATFNFPYGITTDGTNLYVVDTLNYTIRQVVISSGKVTTLAGTAGVSGSADGIGPAASFNFPEGISSDGTNLYVADPSNKNIRQIVIATGAVTTLGGSYILPSATTTDGTALYVSDAYRIMRIQN